jgi:hypothetical protein
MAQNDWYFNVNEGYGNATPPEGTAIQHSSLSDPIPESANAGEYTRRWQFWENGNSWTGCFIRTKKTEFINVPDTKAISMTAWVRSQNDGGRDAYTGIAIKATDNSWSVNAYNFDIRPNSNQFFLEGSYYAPPSELGSVQSNRWYHLRFDVIPIKHNGSVIMDRLRGFVEVNGEWVLVGEKYIEATDGAFVSWEGTRYNGVKHYYNSYYTTSYFYVDKIKMYLEDVEYPENVFLSLTNDTGISSTDNITNDPSLTVLSPVETGAVVRYSTNSYNWQDTIPTASIGQNIVYAKQVSANGASSRATKIEFSYSTGSSFTSEATSSVYTDMPSNSLLYRAEATNAVDFSYALKQVNDYEDFIIDTTTGEIKNSSSLDYATKSSYNFTVQAIDLAGNTTEKPVLLNVLEGDEHYYNTSLILKMDNDLSCSSAYEQDVTVSGVVLTGSVSKYGGSSAYFDGGTNTGLQIPSSGLLDLRNTDWTIEAWINPDGNYDDYRLIVAKRNYSGDHDYQIYLQRDTGELMFYEQGAGTSINTGVTPAANQWSHVAAVRKDGVITIYLNGEAVASQTRNIVYHRSHPLGIGNVGTLNRYPFRGYIDDVRITKGVARYTKDFVPPGPVPSSGPAPSIVSENLALHLDAGDSGSYSGGDTWYDLTTNNNIFTTSSVSFETENEISYFRFSDNDNGQIYQENSSILTGVSDYTFETWMRFNSTQTNQYFMSYAVSGSSMDNELTIGKALDSSRLRVYENQISSDFASAFSNISTGDWFHLVVSSEGTTTIVYVNGQQVGTSTRTAEQYSSMTSGGTLLFGQEQDSLGGGFDNTQEFVGDMSQIRIYTHKGLSAKEVTRNFDFAKSKFGIE